MVTDDDLPKSAPADEAHQYEHPVLAADLWAAFVHLGEREWMDLRDVSGDLRRVWIESMATIDLHEIADYLTGIGWTRDH